MIFHNILFDSRSHLGKLAPNQEFLEAIPIYFNRTLYDRRIDKAAYYAGVKGIQRTYYITLSAGNNHNFDVVGKDTMGYDVTETVNVTGGFFKETKEYATIISITPQSDGDVGQTVTVEAGPNGQTSWLGMDLMESFVQGITIFGRLFNTEGNPTKSMQLVLRGTVNPLYTQPVPGGPQMPVPLSSIPIIPDAIFWQGGSPPGPDQDAFFANIIAPINAIQMTFAATGSGAQDDTACQFIMMQSGTTS